MTSSTTPVHFWNGNKSPTRRTFEQELLILCLQQGGRHNAHIIVNDIDYPNAQDEGNIFENDCDVLVTVAGNQKFLGKRCIVIEQALCQGLLGHRLLVIPTAHAQRFAALTTLKQLQQMTIGIPATWADADLFRHNGFSVAEKGSLDDIFTRLLLREFDYIALGANEIEAIFKHNQHPPNTLMIETNILIYYPLPLVFYVHPDKQELANTIKTGLSKAIANGKHKALFDQHHPNVSHRLGLSKRKTFTLSNPHLPESLKAYRPAL
ncbi:MAG: hypothetical protein ACJA0G_001403 [Kangiellaceae bacterium]|jgi:hypothetical protein